MRVLVMCVCTPLQGWRGGLGPNGQSEIRGAGELGQLTGICQPRKVIERGRGVEACMRIQLEGGR